MNTDKNAIERGNFQKDMRLIRSGIFEVAFPKTKSGAATISRRRLIIYRCDSANYKDNLSLKI